MTPTETEQQEHLTLVHGSATPWYIKLMARLFGTVSTSPYFDGRTVRRAYWRGAYYTLSYEEPKFRSKYGLKY